MGIKNKIKSAESSLKTKIDNLKHDVSYAKEIMATKDIVFLKTDALAILVRKKGETKKSQVVH